VEELLNLLLIIGALAVTVGARLACVFEKAG
jgi:hypothetical protein